MPSWGGMPARCASTHPRQFTGMTIQVWAGHVFSLLVPNLTEFYHAGSSNVQFQRLDISDPASVKEFGKWAKAELSTVSVLINNAGESCFLLMLWQIKRALLTA